MGHQYWGGLNNHPLPRLWFEDAEVTAGLCTGGGSSGSLSAGPGMRVTENKRLTDIGACLTCRVKAHTEEGEQEEEEEE